MPKKYEISKEEAEEIKSYRKKVRDKYEDRRMLAVQLRGEGLKNKEISEKLAMDKRQVSHYVSLYRKGGLDALKIRRGGGRPPKMTYAEEEAMLDEFRKEAESGKVIEVGDIKEKYIDITGSSTRSHGQIYRVLHRHNWRKVKPGSKHPKKASEEAIEASKKLKLE